MTFKTEPVAIKAWAEKRIIYLELTDGRIFGFPADRFRILSQASENQLKQVQIEVGGYALRWEDLDEDLTVRGRSRWAISTPFAQSCVVSSQVDTLGDKVLPLFLKLSAEPTCTAIENLNRAQKLA